MVPYEAKQEPLQRKMTYRKVLPPHTSGKRGIPVRAYKRSGPEKRGELVLPRPVRRLDLYTPANV